MTLQSITKDPKELAYLYDLYIVPGWRELFDQFVDEEIVLPTRGRILDAGCGTGGYAIDLAFRLGADAEIIGVEEDEEKLLLANGKAEIKQVENVRFMLGTLENTGLAEADFDFVLADLSLLAPLELTERLDEILAELRRVAKYDATVILKLATRGSFDEIYSLYWEALYELGLEEYTPQIEDFINERLTIDQMEALTKAAGFRRIETKTRKQQYDFADADEFLTSPLFQTVFLPHWMAILSSKEEEAAVQQALARIIDRERDELDFDLSARFTLVIAKR